MTQSAVEWAHLSLAAQKIKQQERDRNTITKHNTLPSSVCDSAPPGGIGNRLGEVHGVQMWPDVLTRSKVGHQVLVIPHRLQAIGSSQNVGKLLASAVIQALYQTVRDQTLN